MKRHEKDTWTKRYAAWTRRNGGTLQCSPALGVLAVIVVFGAVIYVYREIILTTLLTAVAAAIAVSVFAGAIAVTVSTFRWYRKRSRAMAVHPSGAVAVSTLADDENVKAISKEADWLAAQGSELVFDSEGNLHAKTAKKS